MNSEDAFRWDDRYRQGMTPWDTNRPSAELQRVVAEQKIAPCRALDLGCGTGTNAVWLAQQGFEVTGVDISPIACERARTRAEAAGVKVRILTASVVDDFAPGETFDFIFDRGCYHAVRRDNLPAFIDSLRRITHPGTLGLFLAGNSREPHTPGPPVVSEAELRAELGQVFEIIRLREFRFDLAIGDSVRFLGWSCLGKVSVEPAR